MLYPEQNECRALVDLGGYWRFNPDPLDEGGDAGWPLKLPEDAMLCVVPGSWNEQLAERGLLDYVGSAWYETEVILHDALLLEHEPWLRVGAVEHRADVWLNGTHLAHHEGGYLPFEVDLSDAWIAGKSNRLTIRVDNRLTLHTLPQGIDPDSAPYDGPAYARRHSEPATRFDFHTYGGITRAVYLQALPKAHLSSIAIDARLDGQVEVRAELRGLLSRVDSVSVRILDGDRQEASPPVNAAVAGGSVEAMLMLPAVRAWCPADPHLYVAELTVHDATGRAIDRYEESFGVREIEVREGRLLLNGSPLFLTGCGKHEEFPVIGRGQFRAGYLRDFELLRWLGANSFRTSHYPYDEEIMRLADRMGFLVIDEVPAVSLGFWSDDFDDLKPLLDTHLRFVERLIERDRNHPSVISWSIVNEPNLWAEPNYQNEASDRYFRAVYDHARSLDDTRPVMAITFVGHSYDDACLAHCDVIGLNRYYGWYDEPVRLEQIHDRLGAELDAVYERYRVPIVLTEFGADTIEGQHATTPQLFTEEYQDALLAAYCDVVESRPFCAGEHVWNFADFRTTQHYRRVVLNRKGLFTRERYPKRAAFAMRERWHRLERVDEMHRHEAPDPELLVTRIAARSDRQMADTVPASDAMEPSVDTSNRK